MTDLSSVFYPYVALLVVSIMFCGIVWRWTPLLNRDVWLVLGLMFLVAQMGLAMLAMNDQLNYYASSGQTTLSFGNMPAEYFNWPIYIGLFCLAVWSIMEIRFRLSFRREYRAKTARPEPPQDYLHEAANPPSEPEPVVNDNTQAFSIKDLTDAVSPIGVELRPTDDVLDAASPDRGLRPLHNGRVNVGLDILNPRPSTF